MCLRWGGDPALVSAIPYWAAENQSLQYGRERRRMYAILPLLVLLATTIAGVVVVLRD